MQQPERERFKDESFPGILKRERILRGWSQADVAARIGSDPKTVGRWERGLTFPSPYLCQRLSELYEKTAQELGLVVNKQRAVSKTRESEEKHTANEMNEVPILVQQEVIKAVTEPLSLSTSHKLGNRHWLFSKSDGRVKRPLLFCGLFIILLLVSGSVWYLIRDVFTIPVSKAAQLSENPYTGQGNLALNESLQTNTASSWSLSNNDEGQCFFADKTYRIRVIKAGGYMKLCSAEDTYFNDFTYEVQMKVVAGGCGGLGFRSTFSQLYYFVICQDGNYRFVRYDRDKVSNRRIMVSGVSSLIQQGMNRTNVLAVVAKGNTFTLYINHQQLYHGTDGAYLDGQIALLAHSCSIVYLTPEPDVCAVPGEVVFSNARVWKP